MPADLTVTARSDDGVIMGIRHKSLPISAVQFHPESLLTLQGEVGMRMIANLLRNPHGERPDDKIEDPEQDDTTNKEDTATDHKAA